MKKHLKRLNAPRTWAIPRKTQPWAAKPAPGPHPIDRSLPLAAVLRDLLGYATTAREAGRILADRVISVDGRVVTRPKFPVGLMDVVSISTTKEHFRLLVDVRGRLRPVRTETSAASWKLCRVENKTTVGAGKMQINLHDGRNLLLPSNAYATGATLKVAVPKQSVLTEYSLEPGRVVLLIGGQHVGEIAHVERIERTRNPRANVVHFREGFSTDVDKVFVIGEETPEVQLPETPILEAVG